MMTFYSPHAHFTKRIIPTRKLNIPARPEISRRMKPPFALVESVALVMILNQENPQIMAAITAKPSHTYHSKSLGLKGILAGF